MKSRATELLDAITVDMSHADQLQALMIAVFEMNNEIITLREKNEELQGDIDELQSDISTLNS